MVKIKSLVVVEAVAFGRGERGENKKHRKKQDSSFF